MTKLEKFLLANSDSIIKSDTTESRYFSIQNVLIRVSDHVSMKGNSDIQIIIPNNKMAAGLYTVLFGDSGKVLIWNFKQIQEFLPSLILMKEMTTKSTRKPDPNKSMPVIQKIELAKQQPENIERTMKFTELIESKIKLKYANVCERSLLLKGKSVWTVNDIRVLNVMLRKEFGRGDSINEDFQIFLNHTPVDYNDVLNIYKIVVIDNERVPTIPVLQEAYNYIR